MGKILQGRYDRLLRRTTAQVGFGSKVGEALEDLFPTLDVENAPMELMRASGWTFGMTAASRSPTATKRAGVALFNPVDSGHLVVFTSAWFRLGADGLINIGPIFAALPTVLFGTQRDTRDGAIRQTVAQIHTSPDVVQSAGMRIHAISSTSYNLSDMNGLGVLAPGTGMQISADAVDVSLSTGFMWRERVAEPEELDF